MSGPSPEDAPWAPGRTKWFRVGSRLVVQHRLTGC